MDLSTRRSYSTSIRNVAAERDFNRVDLANEPIDGLEKRLAVVEGDVAAAIRRIRAARDLHDVHDRNLVLNLIGLLAIRTPHRRRATDRFMGDVAKGVMKLALETPERWEAEKKRAGIPDGGPSYEDMKAFVDSGEYDIAASRQVHIGLELSAAEGIIQMLAHRKWMLYRANVESTGGFVTSDHPVCLTWIKPMPGPYSPGFGLANTEVIFPLSADLCMVGRLEWEGGVADLSFRAVAKVNGATVWNAGERVFARDSYCVFLPNADSEFPRSIEDAIALNSKKPM